MRFRGPDASSGYRLLHQHQNPPAMPLVTHVSEVVCTRDHVREPHSHPVFEIIYVLAGRGERWVGRDSTPVGPGDIFVIRPGEVHGARSDAVDPWHFFTIAFDPAWLAPRGGKALTGPESDLARAADETDALTSELQVLDERIIHGGEGAEHIFRRILAELDRAESDPRKRALSAIMVQALVIELLVFVARCSIAWHERAAGSFRLRTPSRDAFRDLVAWLGGRLTDPPSLAEMARRVGLSPAHFAVAFKREVGQTPLEHVTTLRIEEAGRRLVEDRRLPITRVAYDLGFSSSQYFSVVFRKTLGCTPREWRARNARGG